MYHAFCMVVTTITILLLSNCICGLCRRRTNVYLNATAIAAIVVMSTVKLQRTRSFTNLFRYFLKNPIAIMSTQKDLLDAALYTLNNNLAWVEGNKKPTPIADVILQIMKKHRVYQLNELMQKEPETMKSFLQTQNLSTIIDNCRTFINATTQKHDIFEIHHFRGSLDPRAVHNILLRQKLHVDEFDWDFYARLTKKTEKKNTFVLYGPSNTGKSSFIRPLLQLLVYGEVTNSNSFMWQHCINKDILLWEEPLIGSSEIDKCKLVFEGTSTDVAIKFKEPARLYRTPVFITTNHTLWRFCDNERAVFENRCTIYTFAVCFDARTTNVSSADDDSCKCAYCTDARTIAELDRCIKPSSIDSSSDSDTGPADRSENSITRSEADRIESIRRHIYSATNNQLSDDITIRLDDDRRSISIGQQNQLSSNTTGSTVGSSSSTTIDNTRSCTSDRPSDTVETGITGWLRKPISVPNRRGNNKSSSTKSTVGHPIGTRARSDCSSRRIRKRPSTQKTVSTSNSSHRPKLDTSNQIPLKEYEKVGRSPVDQLDEADWCNYLAYLQHRFN